jgi:hypothetical protein
VSKTHVNEGSTSYHPITIIDKDGVAATPESLRYRLTGNNGEEVIEWTTIETNSAEIEVDATSNTIGTTGAKRYLTVEATHNGGDKITSELAYTLVNLKGIP